MKTAEEVLISYAINIDGFSLKTHGYNRNVLVEAMKEYAEQACEEQRELCQEVFNYGDPKIRNAPKPELK